ncbi:MAG: class I SAM-dependent methyltransferase, partial [Bacteroidales bacterium]|nr:class I SAM-dependent methyltransferase [Bacteroidales bacterium]
MVTLPTDKAWKAFGRYEPYFGVVGQEKYLIRNFDEQVRSDFFTSGKAYVEELFSTIKKRIDFDFKPSTILDFGCGPGRMVIPFSGYTKEIVGMDVSWEVLREAEKNCVQHNVKNAVFGLSDDSLRFIGERKFDLVHSFIVLQHLNTNRGEKLVQGLLKALAPGGVGVLHFTYHDHYPNRCLLNYFRFRIPYLFMTLRYINCMVRGKKFVNLPQMQTHNYNLNEVFTYLQGSGIGEV